MSIASPFDLESSTLEVVRFRGWSIELWFDRKSESDTAWSWSVVQPDRRGGFSPCLGYPNRQHALAFAEAHIMARLSGVPSEPQADLFDGLGESC
jgi:hypothetical protein